MDSDARHDLECAAAAYAVLIERAERDHGFHSQEAKELRRDWRDYLKRSEAGEAP